jgi:hypothetical protein
MPILQDEQELENYLFNLYQNPQNDNPLEISGKCFKQVRVGGYGIIDLLCIDVEAGWVGKNGTCPPTIHIQIIELKKGCIDFNSIGQVSRYKTAIEQYISCLPKQRKGIDVLFNISCILVGNHILNGDISYLVKHLDWLSVYFYSLSLDGGVKFKFFYAEDKSCDMPDETVSALDDIAMCILPDYRFFLKDYLKKLNNTHTTAETPHA